MFFTRMQTTLGGEIKAGLYANEPISSRKGIHYLRGLNGKEPGKRVGPLVKRHEEDKIAGKNLSAMKHDSARIKAPIMVSLEIRGRKYQVLVDSGADESYMD